MSYKKYGVTTQDNNGKVIFHYFLGDDDIYDGLIGALGLVSLAPGAYDLEMRFETQSGLRSRIAVRLADAATNEPKGRRLLWCGTDFLEEVVYEGNLNGLAYGGTGYEITSAYVPRNQAYS